jgi:hypothetical protein
MMSLSCVPLKHSILQIPMDKIPMAGALRSFLDTDQPNHNKAFLSTVFKAKLNQTDQAPMLPQMDLSRLSVFVQHTGIHWT